jgi:ferrochelatase
VRALVDAVGGALDAAGPGAHLVMAAHSVPRRSVSRGDPYVHEVELTARALARALPAGVSWHLAFQSRVGPVGWVGPDLAGTLERLGRSGVRSVVVAPISFTSEHLETMVELDIEARERASAAGLGTYVRAPVPGLHPELLGTLARLARREAGRG